MYLPNKSFKQTRVLHVIHRLGRGGIQSWLVQALRRIDREQFQNDFLVCTDQPFPYDEEVRAMGCRIFRCPQFRNPWKFARTFNSVLREKGPYDVVHAHRGKFSGYVLKLAHSAGIRHRIAHSHNDTRPIERPSAVRSTYGWQCRRWIRRHATTGLACSEEAAISLYGPNWQRDSRWRLLQYGIDLEPFRQTVDPAAVRDELGIPHDAFVLGNAGRFYRQKNHRLLLKIAAAYLRRAPNMWLVLMGDGPLRDEIEQHAARLGIADRVVMPGIRRDVPRLLKGAVDLFLFPSLHEGLPVALIEAQAAGVPSIFSSVISSGIDAVPQLLRRQELADSTEQWADGIDELRKRDIAEIDTLRILDERGFSIARSTELLLAEYTGGGQR